MEFIEYLEFSTGQEQNDIDNWKLKNSYDLIQEFIKHDRAEQLILSSVTFCLLSKEDKTFEDWVHNNFNKQGNCFVNKINETVTYSQDALIDLYNFYCDRIIAN